MACILSQVGREGPVDSQIWLARQVFSPSFSTAGTNQDTVLLLAVVALITVGTGAVVLLQSGPSCEMKALLVRLEN